MQSALPLMLMLVQCAALAVRGLSVASTTTMMARGFGAGPTAFKYSGALRPGKLSPTSLVPAEIGRPDYALDGKPKNRHKGMPWDIQVQTPEDIQVDVFPLYLFIFRKCIRFL